jgi:hypothetical protein
VTLAITDRTLEEGVDFHLNVRGKGPTKLFTLEFSVPESDGVSLVIRLFPPGMRSLTEALVKALKAHT